MKGVSFNLSSHFNQNFSIQEVGMKLTPEHYSQIKAHLSHLESRAPSSSIILAKFTSEETEIIGELTISGGGKHFQSLKAGLNPWELYLQLEEDIDNQLYEWKRSRFMASGLFPNLPDGQNSMSGGNFSH